MKTPVVLGLLAAACMAVATAPLALADTIVVGGKNFTEQQIMSAMTSELLKAHGFDIDQRGGMGSAAVRDAMENGQIDTYWEYTGTSLIVYNKIKESMSPADTYKKVKELDAQKGIVWLDPSRANNTYALAMNADEAQKSHIATISDLAKTIKDGKHLTFACNAEFYARPDGLAPLEKAYDFQFQRDDIKRMDTGLTYQALKEHQVDVSLVFATDGRIPAFHFVVLKDDKGFFPSYALTPVIRKTVLDKHPEIGKLLNELSAKLDDQTMATLNASVDVDKKSVENVAHDFLKAQKLI